MPSHVSKLRAEFDAGAFFFWLLPGKSKEGKKRSWRGLNE